MNPGQTRSSLKITYSTPIKVDLAHRFKHFVIRKYGTASKKADSARPTVRLDCTQRGAVADLGGEGAQNLVDRQGARVGRGISEGGPDQRGG
jgi:hypothetical protein